MAIMQQLPEAIVADLFTEYLAGGPQLMEMIPKRLRIYFFLRESCW